MFKSIDILPTLFRFDESTFILSALNEKYGNLASSPAVSPIFFFGNISTLERRLQFAVWKANLLSLCLTFLRGP